MSAEPASDAVGKERLRFWYRSFRAVTAVEREISARLRERFGVTLARFDLMAHLFAAPDGLTMGELTRRLLVSGGNTTGLVERLRREGLADREVDALDRRIYRVRLTPQGRALFEEMAEEHEAWVNQIFEGLDATELRQATDLVDRLRRRLVPPQP